MESIKEFLIYIRDFDKSALSALSGKLQAIISQASSDKTVQDIFKVLSGWIDIFNSYITIGTWNLMVKIFKAIGAFLIWVFESLANLLRIVLSWL